MTQLHKRLWLLFYFLLIVGSLTLAITIVNIWNTIESRASEVLKNHVNLLGNSTHSMLESKEMLLDILGKTLVEDKNGSYIFSDTQTLEQLMQTAPSIAGFGLARESGQLTFVSRNPNNDQLPNLLEYPTTRDSFKATLLSSNMVLGRTHYIEQINEWIIPIRKAIRTQDGKLLAIVTAGIRTKGNNQFFYKPIHFGPTNQVYLFREFDSYYQYVSKNNIDHSSSYNERENIELEKQRLNSLIENSRLSIEEIKDHSTAFIYETDLDNKSKIGAAIYNKKYNIWILSTTKKPLLINAFLITIPPYILVYLIFIISTIILIRKIEKSNQKQKEKLLYQSLHDSLTGLPNRNYLIKNENDLFYRKTKSAITIIDIDHFKNINNNFGHDFGDKVLLHLAKELATSTPIGSLLIHLNGDEFIIITPDKTEEGLLEEAQTLNSKITKKHDIEGTLISLSASIGIAQSPTHGNTLNDLLRAADIAKHEAKKVKNNTKFYTEEMQETHLKRMKIEKHLREGMERNEFFMVYQPKIKNNGDLFGVEALIRWKSKNLGFIPPDQFISIAETSGLMHSLGHFIINTALSEISSLQAKFHPDLQLSINLSSLQLWQPDFLNELQQLIARYNFTQSAINLEITENILIEDTDNILPTLNSIHDMGIKISMDDFGTGYSSLNLLKKLPIDELKIDKSFIDDLIHDDTALKMTQSIIAIGKYNNMTIVAEGVEKEEQAEILRQSGCHLFQGYYFAKPMPLNDLEKYVSGIVGNHSENNTSKRVNSPHRG